MLLGKKTIEQALKINVISNSNLERSQRLWQSMYSGSAPWVTKDVPSLRLEKAICREVSNHVTFESEIIIEGAEVLSDFVTKVKEDMPSLVTTMCSMGGVIVKPFIRKGKVHCSYVTPDRCYPLGYNEVGDLTSVAFIDRKQAGDYIYSLLETHTWHESENAYTIAYRVFKSTNESELGSIVGVQSVPEWAHLSDIEWLNIDRPLFVEFNMPEKEAIYADAVEHIRLADQQYGRVVWEYEGGELAINASVDLFRRDANGRLDLPKGKERLFRAVDIAQEHFTLEPFAPTFRDESLFNGLNEHKRAIEFACGLAYGTISDPQAQAKTATEIMAAKQRYLITVRTIQKIIESGLSHLIYSADVLSQLYELYSDSEYALTVTWGDSIMEDVNTEYTRRFEMMEAGVLSAAQFRAWYLGEDLETAEANLPKQTQTTN